MTRGRLAAAALLVGAAAAALLLGRGHQHTAAARPTARSAATSPGRRSRRSPGPCTASIRRARTPRQSGLAALSGPSGRVRRLELHRVPPVLAGGRLFFGTNHGLVLAVEARTGRIAWHRQFAGCIAASPAVGKGVVYIGFMDPPPCNGTAPSFLAALDARTGRSSGVSAPE